MPQKKSRVRFARSPGMSDEAIAKRTGKTWADWRQLLDKAGARKWPHPQIAEWIAEHYPEVGGWWTQTVAVGYERIVGLRALHEKPDGFEISVSRTLPVGFAFAFRAWTDESMSREWLDEPRLVIRQATSGKSLRCSWGETGDRLSVQFWPVGEEKTRVTVQHGKLASSAAAARLKKVWQTTLDHLTEWVEARESMAKRQRNRSR